MQVFEWVRTHLPNFCDDNKLDDLAVAILLGLFAMSLYWILR